MAEEKPKQVTVESIKWHTNGGKEYPVGATYEVEESTAASLANQGMAVRADRVEVAKQAEKDAKKPSHPVAPITTEDMSHKKK